jgi:hypothetical protein
MAFNKEESRLKDIFLLEENKKLFVIFLLPHSIINTIIIRSKTACGGR